jgi:DDE superfamily endonuclease
VFGIITPHGLGPLYRISGYFDRWQYIDVLENLVLPYLADIYTEGNYHYVQDASPIHKAIAVQEWFEQNMADQNVYLPAKSPDLNIIEHYWFLIKQRLSKQYGVFANANELFNAILIEWDNLSNDAELITKMYNSINNRVLSVIAANGGATKY